MTLGEKEARAFAALAEYGIDAFLKTYYEKLGSAYLKPHEDGLRSLFETIRSEINPTLRRADEARAIFKTKPAP